LPLQHSPVSLQAFDVDIWVKLVQARFRMRTYPYDTYLLRRPRS
jgi:hypothetical protein